MLVNRIVPAIFGNQLETYIALVKQMLLQALLSQHEQISEEAFVASCSFIVSLEPPAVRIFGDLLSPMIVVSGEDPLTGRSLYLRL